MNSYRSAIFSGPGSDTLTSSGPGQGLLDGGAGVDLVSYASASYALIVDLNSGLSKRRLGLAYSGDTLLSIEHVIGGQSGDLIVGNEFNNLLDGGAGNDTILGGPGNDTMRGGEGSDTLGFSGNRSAYTVSIISQSDSVYQISSTAEGNDVVSGFEWVQFADTVVSMASLVVGATPIKLYELKASADSVNEGATASFTLTTANVPAGETVGYVIGGDSGTAADLVGVGLSGVLTVGTDGTATLNVPIAADQFTEGNETLTVTAKGQTVSTVIVDTSKTPVPTYSLQANADSVEEGQTASFTLTTTNVASGTKVPYSLTGTGITTADVLGGALSGTATVGANGTATISVGLLADRKTEGNETLTISSQGSSASVTVKDTSLTPQPVYRLTAAAASVNEGSNAVFNLVTENVEPGTVLGFTVEASGGFDASDVVKGRMSGSVAVGSDGRATIRVPIRNDDTTELNAEAITVKVQNQSASMTINDTSKEPVRLSTPPAVVGGTMTFTNASETGKTIFTGTVGAGNTPVAISSGIVEVGAGGSLGSAPVSLGANATLAFGRSDDVAVANPISGAGGFKQSGTGKVVLSSTNTYTGPTTVAAGTLVITGALSGTGQVAVEEGATLGGTGTVAGPVAIGAGGGLAPGASPGAFVMNNGLSIAAGGTLYAEINGTVAGTDYDQLIVSGTVDITDAVLSVSVGFASRPWNSYTIIANDGSDAVVGRFANLAEGAVFAAGSRFMQISYQGGTGNNDVTLTDVPYCLVQGTRVMTPQGEVAVEALRRGDRIVTLQADGRVGESEVRWLGVQRLRAKAWRDPRLMPVCIKAGALGEGLPMRDLYVSPDHGLLVDGHLVHAKALVNGQSIVQVERWVGDVVYWHVETQRHDVMLAEGVPNETLIDAVSRKRFDNYAEYEALYPVEPMIQTLRLPRVQFARQLPQPISDRLRGRAESLLVAAKTQASTPTAA
jgi:autotransporter-associated beta strand protein